MYMYISIYVFCFYSQNRYDALRACIGDEFLGKLADLKLFMVIIFVYILNIYDFINIIIIII